jgi:cell division protein FtsQ
LQEVGKGSGSFGYALNARAGRAVGPSPSGFGGNGARAASRRRFVVTPRLASGLAGMLAAFILTILFASDPNRIRFLTDRIPEIDTAITLAGFGLDQVTVKGNRFAEVGDILDALKLEQFRSFASFDASAARARIEDLSWIATAELRRVYPNQLVVTIHERRPFAVWQNGREMALIDREGHRLSLIDSAAAPSDLPRLSGAAAPEAASELWDDLSRHPSIKKLFLSAERVGKRRWNLNLDNRNVVALPSSGALAALARLEGWPGFTAIKQSGNALIDMRASGRIDLRPADTIGDTSSKPASIAELLETTG